MGHTINKLSIKPVSLQSIFNNRFVTEICELVHVHYRNLRIVMSIKDWIEFAKGCSDSLKRWDNLCKPDVGNKHIELCRKNVASDTVADNSISINLNKNLYNLNEGKIFSEGSNLDEDKYIHLKIRDLRIEMTLSDFYNLVSCVEEAKLNLEDSCLT